MVIDLALLFFSLFELLPAFKRKLAGQRSDRYFLFHPSHVHLTERRDECGEVRWEPMREGRLPVPFIPRNTATPDKNRKSETCHLFVDVPYSASCWDC